MLRHTVPALLVLGTGAVVLGALPHAGPQQTPPAELAVTLAAQPGRPGGSGGRPPGGDGGPSGTFELSGGATGLFPGASSVVRLKIENYSSTAVRVTRLDAAVRRVAPDSCPAGDLVLGTQGSGSVTTSLLIGARGTAHYDFPVQVRARTAETDDSCQGATWTLDYSGTAVKA